MQPDEIIRNLYLAAEDGSFIERFCNAFVEPLGGDAIQVTLYDAQNEMLASHASACSVGAHQHLRHDRLAVVRPGTYSLVYGRITIAANGDFTYSLNNTNRLVNSLRAGQSRLELIPYVVSDGRGKLAASLLTITIRGANDAPLAVDDTNGVREDSAPNPITGNVLGNDSDAEGDRLTVSNPGTFALGHGSLVLRADGSYSYTLDNLNPEVNGLGSGQSLRDEFTYNVSDGRGGTASAVLRVTITGVTDS